uniref:Nicotinamide nucleotide adenylyltransferase 1 n=1 Tax=Paramormyrops kingsleyae TaxID=1676925 RepID=A0A3B3QXM8_9TELE
MAKLAVEDHSWIELDSWESRQAEWLETVKVLHQSDGPDYHKLVEFSFSYPLPSELSMCMSVDASCLRDAPRLMLLCGADMLNSFVVPGLWKLEHIEEIIKNFGLVCITDDGSDLEAIIQGSDDLRGHYSGLRPPLATLPQHPRIARVARDIRRSVRYLLPDPVLSYIQEWRLYTAESEQTNADVLLAPPSHLSLGWRSLRWLNSSVAGPRGWMRSAQSSSRLWMLQGCPG